MIFDTLNIDEWQGIRMQLKALETTAPDIEFILMVVIKGVEFTITRHILKGNEQKGIRTPENFHLCNDCYHKGNNCRDICFSAMCLSKRSGLAKMSPALYTLDKDNISCVRVIVNEGSRKIKEYELFSDFETEENLILKNECVKLDIDPYTRTITRVRFKVGQNVSARRDKINALRTNKKVLEEQRALRDSLNNKHVSMVSQYRKRARDLEHLIETSQTEIGEFMRERNALFKYIEDCDEIHEENICSINKKIKLTSELVVGF